MTDEQLDGPDEKVWQRGTVELASIIAAEVCRAVLIEREACAKVCEDRANMARSAGLDLSAAFLVGTAADIRARSNK